MIKTTLENLPQVMADDNYKNMVRWCIRYQNFKPASALLFQPGGYTASTLTMYLNLAYQYFNQGKRAKYYDKFYDALEIQRKKYVALIPSEDEKRKPYKTKNNTFLKDNPPPVANLEIVKKPLTAKIIYGIRFDDFIKIFDSEEEAKGFNKGMEFAGKESGKIVTVELGEV